LSNIYQTLKFSFAVAQNPKDILVAFITSQSSTVESMDKMKNLGANFLSDTPRSRTQTRVSILTYDNIVDWKRTRDLSNIELSKVVLELPLRKPRSDRTQQLFTESIAQAFGSLKRNQAESVVMVVSDGAPSPQVLEYLNKLQEEKDNKVFLILMKDGVKEISDTGVGIDPLIKIITDGKSKAYDPDKIEEHMKPGMCLLLALEKAFFYSFF